MIDSVSPKTMDLETALLHLRVAGWRVLDGIIPASCVDAIRTRVASVVAVHGRPNAEDGGGPPPLRGTPPPSTPGEKSEGIGFVPGLINLDLSFASYLADRGLLDLVEALLGEHARVSFTSAIVNYPGNPRGEWHADWPFNQNNAGRIRPPYPDAVLHLTTLWMLSPFTHENGGTLIVPSSHRASNNPTGENGVDPRQPYPSEAQVTGEAGSVLLMDSRLWHATAPNHSAEPRVALAVRYAPWWLNLEVLMPGSAERAWMVAESGRDENAVPPVLPEVFQALPDGVKPLFRHWVRGPDASDGAGEERRLP